MNDLDRWESKFESCCYSERLLTKLSLLNEKLKPKKVNILKIKKAIYYAKKYHGDQKRQSGESYYTHPLEVAYLVADHLFETNILVTSILHDTLEDTELTKDMIKMVFGSIVANQVDDLTRVRVDRKISAAETVKLLLLKNKNDLLIVKVCDRLHNMETIQIKSPGKQQQTIAETLQEFMPLVVYLGILILEQKLSNICIRSNLVRQRINLQEQQVFSFQDNYQPLSPVFQNETIQMYIRKALEA